MTPKLGWVVDIVGRLAPAIIVSHVFQSLSIRIAPIIIAPYRSLYIVRLAPSVTISYLTLAIFRLALAVVACGLVDAGARLALILRRRLHARTAAVTRDSRRLRRRR